MVFADDIQVYLSCPPAEINRCLELLMHDANAIATYASSNCPKLNPAKSRVIVFGSSTYIRNICLDSLPPVVINGVVVPFVSEVKSLGVILECDLSWRRHSSHISQKVHGVLCGLKFNKNSLSTALRKKLVVALILPHLDYCC